MLLGQGQGPFEAVACIDQQLTQFAQTLKETFADKLPGEIEKIKKLRKYGRPKNATVYKSDVSQGARLQSRR